MLHVCSEPLYPQYSSLSRIQHREVVHTLVQYLAPLQKIGVARIVPNNQCCDQVLDRQFMALLRNLSGN